MDAPSLLILDPISLPLLGPVEAGFPSPATDYIETSLDLPKLLVRRKAATFFLRVKGSSMSPTIEDKDLLVVDKSIKAAHGDIVIAAMNGEFTVKRLYQRAGFVSLQPDNPNFNPILVEPSVDLEIWGVVTAIIRVSCSR